MLNHEYGKWITITMFITEILLAMQSSSFPWDNRMHSAAAVGDISRTLLNTARGACAVVLPPTERSSTVSRYYADDPRDADRSRAIDNIISTNTCRVVVKKQGSLSTW